MPENAIECAVNEPLWILTAYFCQVAESVVSICSTPMAAKCRLIDRVIITGSRTKTCCVTVIEIMTLSGALLL